MNNQSYREFHERFMENHNGTTIWENLLVISPTPFLVFYLSLAKMFLYYRYRLQKGEKLYTFLLDFFFLITPLTLVCTILSSYLLNVVAVLLFSTILVVVLLTRGKKKMFLKILNTPIQQEKKPYLTYFRSVVSVYSVVCILAVDFRIFPRRFAKTETFGYGLMDTGVGFYLLSNGVVINSKNIKNYTKFTFKTFLSCMPIAVLGFIRYISVESVNYQKHVSEYGLHWNFFFTLAIVKLVGSFLVATWPRRIAPIAAITGVLHQLALSGGIQDWIISDYPRDDVFSANREGILSIPGYLSLYLSSVSMGAALRSKVNTLYDALYHSFRLLVAFVAFTILTIVSESWFGVSRRLTNLTYILWLTSLTLYIFSISLLAESCVRTVCFFKKVPVKAVLVPVILEAINSNGLVFFLVGNLNTGLVNLSLNTLFVQPLSSLLILLSYMFVNCGLISIMYFYNVKLKFW